MVIVIENNTNLSDIGYTSFSLLAEYLIFIKIGFKQFDNLQKVPAGYLTL